MPQSDIHVHPDLLPQVTSRDGVSLREDTLFTDARGREKRGPRKTAEKSLQQLQEILPRVLEPGEAVLWMARCETHASTLERLTLGLYIYSITATVLVFTNRRILEFRVKPGIFGGRGRWKWRKALRAVRWGDIAEAKPGGWLGKTLTLKYQNGRKETFWRLKRLDNKKIRLVRDAILPVSTGESSPAQGIVHLCPQCLAALSANTYQCAQCGQRFKDERTATIRSLLIPGGGYFYTGHVLLGLVDAWVEAVLILFVVLLTLELSGAMPAEPGEPAADWAGLVVFVGFIAVEKAVTIYHARRFVRDYIPLKA